MTNLVALQRLNGVRRASPIRSLAHDFCFCDGMILYHPRFKRTELP
jgi:hypothetical protein